MAETLWPYMHIHSVDDIEGMADTWQHPSQAAIIPADLLLVLYQVDGMPQFISDYFNQRND
jgi:hypothetical protein